MLYRSIRHTAVAFNKLSIRGFKKTIEQLHKEKPNLLADANVLVRVDFNTPLSKTDSTVITDDTRIREALPTINFLTKAGAKVMLASHCGRPKGQVNDKMRMAPMAKRLGELINQPVATVSDCIGAEVDEAVSKMKAGDVLMLENARFYKEEEKNVPEFAEKLAKNATVYVNDAFGTAHRAHASTEGVCKYVDHKVAGFLMEKELTFLKGAVDKPVRPFAAVVGGAKVSTKIPVIESLIEKCDKIFIGGSLGYFDYLLTPQCFIFSIVALLWLCRWYDLHLLPRAGSLCGQLHGGGGLHPHGEGAHGEGRQEGREVLPAQGRDLRH